MEYTVKVYHYQDEAQYDEEPAYKLFESEQNDKQDESDVIRTMQKYGANQTSCSPLCNQPHCWLSSSPDYPIHGDGGAVYVDMFIYKGKADRTNLVYGKELAELYEKAFSEPCKCFP